MKLYLVMLFIVCSSVSGIYAAVNIAELKSTHCTANALTMVTATAAAYVRQVTYYAAHTASSADFANWDEIGSRAASAVILADAARDFAVASTDCAVDPAVADRAVERMAKVFLLAERSLRAAEAFLIAARRARDAAQTHATAVHAVPIVPVSPAIPAVLALALAPIVPVACVRTFAVQPEGCLVACSGDSSVVLDSTFVNHDSDLERTQN